MAFQFKSNISNDRNCWQIFDDEAPFGARCVFTQMSKLKIGTGTGNNYSTVKCILCLKATANEKQSRDVSASVTRGGQGIPVSYVDALLTLRGGVLRPSFGLFWFNYHGSAL